MCHAGAVSYAIAVLGSASDVGKSLVTVALCRLLSNLGRDVVPFKAQNMGNQAGVTPDGLEMPRAQILQALACRKAPHVDMGPVLMKPVSPTGAQIIVLGHAIGQHEAREYFADTSHLSALAMGALDRLRETHECIVIEGAGSPVELNLWDRDFVNLRPVRRAHAAILLVVDIDKGGVFAQAKGTLDLLPEADRARVMGIVVNRFRGDLSLFEDGVPLLERICNTKVLGVVPYLEHGLDEEDRPIRIPVDAPPLPGKLNIGVILYPRVSNTEDIFPLLAEPDANVTFLTDPKLAAAQQLIVLPGSKASIADLIQMTASGMTERIRDAHARGTWLLGLCGGYQMLGESLVDAQRSEGGPTQWEGLGVLPITTQFREEKVTAESECVSAWPEASHSLSGYEIHHGRTRSTSSEGQPLALRRGAELGWCNGRALGAYLHGLLASDTWRQLMLNRVRRDHGLKELPTQRVQPLEQRICRWVEHFQNSLRPGALEIISSA
ncbi:MAG TPA: cobyric acid synthase, partial [Polyangiaceae bacterium]